MPKSPSHAPTLTEEFVAIIEATAKANRKSVPERPWGPRSEAFIARLEALAKAEGRDA